MTHSNDDHTAYSYSVVNDRLSSNHFDWWFQIRTPPPKVRISLFIRPCYNTLTPACTEEGLQTRALSPPQFVLPTSRRPSIPLKSHQGPERTREVRRSFGFDRSRLSSAAKRNACHISCRNMINAWRMLEHRCLFHNCQKTRDGCFSDRIGRITYALLLVGVSMWCASPVLVRSTRVQERCCVRSRQEGRTTQAVRKQRLILREQQ